MNSDVQKEDVAASSLKKLPKEGTVNKAAGPSDDEQREISEKKDATETNFDGRGTFSICITSYVILSRFWRKLIGTKSQITSPNISKAWIKPLQLPLSRLNARLLYFIKSALVIKFAFAVIWIISFAVLVDKAQFSAKSSYGAPEVLDPNASLWRKNNNCGIDGQLCQPFTTDWVPFRCFSSEEKLWNPYTVGFTEIYFKPLVIGGGNTANIYRADSWICPSAVHAGIIKRSGGCGLIRAVGEVRSLSGNFKNGIESVGFDSVFPKGYEIRKLTSENCSGCRNSLVPITVFNSLMLLFWGFFANELELFSATVICGFLHASFVSDPPTLINRETLFSTSSGRFFPTIAFSIFIWRLCFKKTFLDLQYVIPIERLIYFYPTFWVGLLINITGKRFPIQRLTAEDMNEPGFIRTLIIMIFVVVLIVIGQIYTLRKHGLLQRYLGYYAFFVSVILIISASIPRIILHLHHYFLALCLLPGTGIQTRPSIIYQGFLLGWFINGCARWGFDSIYATKEMLARDGAKSNIVPMFTTVINQSQLIKDISWKVAAKGGNNLFSLLVDDVERARGSANSFDLDSLREAYQEWNSMNHYFRIGVAENGEFKAYSKPAILARNGTWINATPGVT